MRRHRYRRTRLDLDEPAPTEFGLLVDGLRLEVKALVDDFKRALRVEWLGVKTGAVDSVSGAVLYLSLFGFGIVLVIASAISVALGLSAELGHLWAGLALFAGGLAVIVMLRVWLRRRGVRRARRVLEEETEIDDEI